MEGENVKEPETEMSSEILSVQDGVRERVSDLEVVSVRDPEAVMSEVRVFVWVRVGGTVRVLVIVIDRESVRDWVWEAERESSPVGDSVTVSVSESVTVFEIVPVAVGGGVTVCVSDCVTSAVPLLVIVAESVFAGVLDQVDWVSVMVKESLSVWVSLIDIVSLKLIVSVRVIVWDGDFESVSILVRDV
jgi:hypothetical protein